MLMFTYGMNTNREHMAALCPTARSLGQAILPNHRLMFKRHCDVETYQGAQTVGVLWDIDEKDIEIFDRLEGYPVYYERKTVEVWYNTERISALVYYMTPGYTYQVPSDGYFQTVRDGYIAHGLDVTQLIYAVANTRHVLADRVETPL